MRLVDIGSSPPVVCTSDTPVARVARQMVQHDIGSIVILGPDDTVAGIVTDRDLVTRVLSADRAPDTPVSEVMSHEVACILDSASPDEAARQMALRVCRRLPIVDTEGRTIGVVSADDIVRHDATTLEHLGALVSHQHVPRRYDEAAV
jgi:CBS domain-containing protein